MAEVKRFATEPIACYKCGFIINKEIYYDIDKHATCKKCNNKEVE